MLRTAAIGLVGSAVFTISGTIHADVMDMSFETAGVYGRAIHYSYDPTGSHTNPLINGNTTAGRLDWTVMSQGPVSFGGHIFNNGDQFSTFCSELTEFISPGQTYTYSSMTVADMPANGDSFAMGAFRAGLLQDLFDNHFEQAVSGSTTEAAAFQVAVWEIAYEDRLGELGSGGGPPLSELLAADADTFVISEDSTVVGLANAWLDELAGGILDNSLIGFDGGTESASQPNQIMVGEVVAVPLPAPFLLAGMGLVAVVLGRKQLRRLAGT